MAPVDYQRQRFAYVRHPDQDAAPPARHPVVVVGAGPVGLTLAIDLAQHGIAVLLLDHDNRLSSGSRAICFAKRTLEIFDRLGCAERMVDKGVSWQRGRVFMGDEQVYEFDLQPDPGHERPAFINLQQYYVEGFLVERAATLPLLDIRWSNKLTGIVQYADHAVLTLQTPEGEYRIAADHVAACDGSRSALRHLVGPSGAEEMQGRSFKDRFLIADVKMALDRPAERWFWFDPAFHRNQSVLLHRQSDNVWRIDFQLGWDADPEEEKKPENIIPRVQALLSHSAMKDTPFQLEWASVYTFSCQRMARFRHGRVLFAGDSAHGVSPFGARGANSGVQDADNLAWKLAAVLRGQAGEALLDSYADERELAADENILQSTRATDFITPKSELSRLFRDAVLQLAKQHAFARTLVNSGRLSVPATLHRSALNTDDETLDPSQGAFRGPMVPGAVAADAPLHPFGQAGQAGQEEGGRAGWLLRAIGTGSFAALVFGEGEAADRSVRAVTEAAAAAAVTLTVVRLPLNQAHALAALRYDAQPGTAYLLRPDQHVCARWRQPQTSAVRAALDRALARR